MTHTFASSLAPADIYNARTGAFYTLGELDPALGGRDLTRSGTFIYEDGDGVSWLVAVAPFLLSTDGATSTLSEQPALVMLVFSQWDLATASLPALHADIEHTASGVYLTTGIIAGAILLGMLVLMVALISWLTAPLSQIRLILTRIIAISAEEESRRDYREIVDASWFDLKRSDELGCLATSFWYMVIQLHNSCEAKKARPRYTPNPLHMSAECMQAVNESASGGDPLLTIGALVVAYEAAHAAPVPDPVSSKIASNSAGRVATEAEIIGGDVLAQLSQSNAYALVSTHGAVTAVDIGSSLDAEGALSGMEIGRLPRSATARANPVPVVQGTAYAAVSGTTAVEPLPPPLPPRTCKVFTLQFYLSALATALILGLMAIMAAAIFLLQSEGSGWMQDTTDTIEHAEIVNLATITLAKAAFITVGAKLLLPAECFETMHINT